MIRSMSTTVTPTVRRPRAGSAGDEQLVAAIRAGSEPAVTALVERYRPQLLGFAAKMLGEQRNDAEDCVQDALLSAIRALRRDPGREIDLRPWLHTIVRNRCLDLLRRPQRNTALDDQSWRLADAGPGPATQIGTRERLDAMVASLGELPERQRRALVMHELEGRSHSAIGHTLGIGRGASKALVCRARRGIADSTGRQPL